MVGKRGLRTQAAPANHQVHPAHPQAQARDQRLGEDRAGQLQGARHDATKAGQMVSDTRYRCHSGGCATVRLLL